jgi:hypothetical protein
MEQHPQLRLLRRQPCIAWGYIRKKNRKGPPAKQQITPVTALCSSRPDETVIHARMRDHSLHGIRKIMQLHLHGRLSRNDNGGFGRIYKFRDNYDDNDRYDSRDHQGQRVHRSLKKCGCSSASTTGQSTIHSSQQASKYASCNHVSTGTVRFLCFGARGLRARCTFFSAIYAHGKFRYL